jgi:tetratricopeptide (TPR) repeat protein
MKQKPVIAGIIAVLAIVVVIVAVRSCREDEVVPPPGGEKPPVTVDDDKPETLQAFHERIGGMMQAGDTNGAIQELTVAYEAGTYGEGTPRVLSMLVQGLVTAGRVGEAEAKFIEAAGKDPELIGNALGVIYGHKVRSGDDAATFEWTKQLQEMELPESAARPVFAWHLDACYSFGQRKRIRELVPKCIETFEPTESANILKYVVGRLIARKKFDAAGGLVSMIGEGGQSVPELAKLVRVLRVNLAVETGEWEDIVDLVMQSAEVVDDRDLRQLFSRLCARALAQDEAGVVDQLCEYLLTQQKHKAATVREASRQWIALLKKYDKAGDIPARFGLLEKVGVAHDVRAALFRDEFYYVLGKAGPEGIAAMVKLGNALNAGMPAGDEKERLKVMLVDGCFMTEDYEGALALLESGIENRDEQWTRMATDKVQAHLALKRGDVDGAVKCFRKFMEYVETWESAETDPSTGVRHTKEMTLGFNTKRIAGIYKDAGRMKEAEAAYDEARKYYEKALEDAKEGSKSRAHILKEMAELPGGVKEAKPAPVEPEKPPAVPETPEKPAERAEPVEPVEPEKTSEPTPPAVEEAAEPVTPGKPAQEAAPAKPVEEPAPETPAVPEVGGADE